MSHISTIELEVKDLGILGQACSKVGLELVKGQKTHKWYGRDSHCDHAIKVTGAHYEIGVVQKDGQYELKCDFYDRNIEQAIGKQGGLLKQAYAVEKARVEARRKGYSVLEKRIDTGIRLHVRVA
jgi:hypothetical protein